MRTLAVIAKAPVAGAAKTRLAPDVSLEQAAQLAAAALRDTLRTASAAIADRRVLVLDGERPSWVPGGFEVIPQRGAGLDERLANAFADIGPRTLIVGMDTPQMRPTTLSRALALLDSYDAVLGPAVDGGYWAIGLRRPDGGLLRGVPMSRATTLRHQRERLRAHGLSWEELETLRDVDTYADAVAVAARARHSQFARTLAEIARSAPVSA
jgi:rSAM/selenodomain-associated transferase 1